MQAARDLDEALADHSLNSNQLITKRLIGVSLIVDSALIAIARYQMESDNCSNDYPM